MRLLPRVAYNFIAVITAIIENGRRQRKQQLRVKQPSENNQGQQSLIVVDDRSHLAVNRRQ